MRKAACWLFTLLLCGSAFGRDVIVASYNIESYPVADERKDGGGAQGGPEAGRGGQRRR